MAPPFDADRDARVQEASGRALDGLDTLRLRVERTQAASIAFTMVWLGVVGVLLMADQAFVAAAVIASPGLGLLFVSLFVVVHNTLALRAKRRGALLRRYPQGPEGPATPGGQGDK